VKIAYSKKSVASEKLDCLIVPLAEDALNPPASLSDSLSKTVRNITALKEFSGKAGESLLVVTGAASLPRVLLVGMGKKKEITGEGLRRIAGQAAQHAGKLNVGRVGFLLPKETGSIPTAEAAKPLAEGAMLGAYRFETYKSMQDDKKNSRASLKQWVLLDPEGISAPKAMQEGVVRAEATILSRDLGNLPANDMTPDAMAKRARALAKRHGLKVKVLERAEMERLGMGMFMGVAKGSRQPPKMIILEYRAKKASQTLAFVGKGITFDSGGISLKPGAAMDEMKFDMCGAAAVLGAMEGVGRAKPAVNVIGVIPACENLPDGEAVKPGDILRSYTGKTVEVLNTDAEGRLILGDALAYTIKQYKPEAVVDLATLTGACVIALGHYATGAVGNHDGLMERLVSAGQSSGDIVWPLPNFPEYGKGLEGKYGDLQNIAGRDAGAITGGLFLKHFVGETPWVHLDIAGTAWGVKNIGHIPHEGATGVGARLLLDLAQAWKPLAKSRKQS